MKPQQALIDQVLAERPEPTVALNPLTGLHLDDLKEIFSKTALQGARQPLILSKHLSNHARKLVDILARRADYAPDRSDSRFRDDSWNENGG